MHRSGQKRIYASMAAKVNALFEELSATPGPSTHLRARATGMGWHPPLAWDDIDNDPEPAATSENTETGIDQTAVEYAINGVITGDRLRPEERRFTVETMLNRNITVDDIAARLHIDRATVQRDVNAIHNRRRRARREGR